MERKSVPNQSQQMEKSCNGFYKAVPQNARGMVADFTAIESVFNTLAIYYS